MSFSHKFLPQPKKNHAVTYRKENYVNMTIKMSAIAQYFFLYSFEQEKVGYFKLVLMGGEMATEEMTSK